MKMIIKLLPILFLLLWSSVQGQVPQYKYQRELQEVLKPWHKVVLPNEVFGKINQDMSDIRLYGINDNGDTLEAPYLIRQAKESIISTRISFRMLNTVYNEKGYYFTLEVPNAGAINQIKLEFEQLNFDWYLDLEGSQDQKEWFTVTDNYRILSINNQSTDFQFTTLNFPISKYRFFRLFIKSKVRPRLKVASISQNKIKDGILRDYSIKSSIVKENKKLKQTEVAIELMVPVALNKITMEVMDNIDYFRRTTIRYLTDSVATEKGWKYNYRTLARGTLNSMETHAFTFDNRIVKKFKVIIQNQDNQALNLGAVKASGYIHEVIARFTEPAKYFLTYGNSDATIPQYDIQKFSNKIPKELVALSLGNEQFIQKINVEEKKPLFQNKNWLWAIMGITILILGWFSIKMIKNK